MMKKALLALLISLVSSFVLADAIDDASTYSTFNNGDTGGSGFGTWTINTPAVSGSFLATLGGNPNCTILTGGNAWGLWGNTATSEAIRPFNDDLAVNQVFAISFQNRNVSSSPQGGIGWALRASGATVFEMYFNGGDANYTYGDTVGGQDTGIAWANSGFDVLFTLTASDAYSVSVTSVGGGSPTVWTGTIDDTNPIDDFRAWNWQANADGTDDANYYLNSMSITTIPEPSTIALLGLGGLGVLGYIRRKKK